MTRARRDIPRTQHFDGKLGVIGCATHTEPDWRSDASVCDALRLAVLPEGDCVCVCVCVFGQWRCVHTRTHIHTEHTHTHTHAHTHIYTHTHTLALHDIELYAYHIADRAIFLPVRGGVFLTCACYVTVTTLRAADALRRVCDREGGLDDAFVWCMCVCVRVCVCVCVMWEGEEE